MKRGKTIDRVNAFINERDERSRLHIAECRSDSNPKTWYKVTIRRGQWECAW